VFKTGFRQGAARASLLRKRQIAVPPKGAGTSSPVERSSIHIPASLIAVEFAPSLP